MYGIYINMGCRFDFRTQKLPYETISGNFFDFIDFGHQVRVCEKRPVFNISCISKLWDLHKFGLQIWIQNAKITLWKNFGQFFRFHRFWYGPCKKRPVFNISCISKCMGFTKFGLQIWMQKLPYERFQTFFRFHHLGHQVCEKRPVFNISRNSKYMGFT